MTSKVRFLTSPNVACVNGSGRSYTANSSGIVDIPYQDAQQTYPSAPGAGMIKMMEIGATSDRPTVLAIDGRRDFYDTTLGAVIFWSGSRWVDINGASA